MSAAPAGLIAALSDRYQIERELGQGGMATVYLARDLKHDRDVALKVLRPELGAVLGPDRFLAEIKITARLDHPHILTLIDSGVFDGFLYYVLPFVRGESLRDLLNREKQLGLDDALAIIKQVGSALDYAHRQGVVHRDIKPENILLQEGEAMLTDFGIALAVKEAGGNRLTETGLSLGTPAYMSPEQATGDRTLDARSDLYSLAAVLYEMLVGEPPVTGATVQAIIAKLLTEQPTRIRTVRNSVPQGIDDAVAKALSKVPADRHHTAGEFLRALETGRTTASMPAATAPARSNALRNALVGIAVVAVAVLGYLLATGKLKGKDTSATLRDRTQLTSTGAILTPALSQDGKQLAYFVKDCGAGLCTYAVAVQDVGGTTTRRVLEGALSPYGIEWSPDRRNLLVYTTLGKRFGTFLVSALGGPPRHLTAGAATFYANGDSLLIGPGSGGASFTVLVAGLDGGVRDSIGVPGPGEYLSTMSTIPGTSRFIALVIQSGHGLWQVLDRSGRVLDHLINSCTCGGMASRDAIWMTRAGPTVAEAVVRVAIDATSGKFASRQDTIYSGRFNGLSVTADGTQMAVDDGTYNSMIQALPLTDLLRGKFPSGAPLLQASSFISAAVSPDGSRILVQRVIATAANPSERHLALLPFAGGAESPLNVSGVVTGADWKDSVTVLVSTQVPGGLQASLIDVRTGQVGATLQLPDSSVRSLTALPGGWAWIPTQGDRIVVDQGGTRHEIARPPWFGVLNHVEASPDGSQLLFDGWGGATSDSLRASVVPAAGGTPTTWGTSFADSGYPHWLADGSIVFVVWSGQDEVALTRLAGPGRSESLGTVPHPARRLDVSGDLKHATIRWLDYKGDAWLYRVVKPQ
jgi:eukaryotic-like serine/threonine-protein kinase